MIEDFEDEFADDPPSEGEYMAGGCWDLALTLHRETGLPLFGLFDAEGQCHHVFVLDDATGTAFDGRGAVHVEAVHLCRGAASNGTLVRPVDEADLIRWRGGDISPYDHERAIQYATELQPDLVALLERQRSSKFGR